MRLGAQVDRGKPTEVEIALAREHIAQGAPLFLLQNAIAVRTAALKLIEQPAPNHAPKPNPALPGPGGAVARPGWSILGGPPTTDTAVASVTTAGTGGAPERWPRTH